MNDPGVLGDITSFIGSKGINISQQINTSRGKIAYTVIDMATRPDDPSALQEELAQATHVSMRGFLHRADAVLRSQS